MGSDCEMLLEMEGGVLGSVPVTVKRERTSAAAWMDRWRVCGALLAVALCAAAALFFISHTKKQDGFEEGNDLQHTLRQVSESAKAAIHLSGEKYDSKFSQTSVKWSDENGHSFRTGGLEVDENDIIIPRQGLYFVYSQASYHVRCPDKDDDDEGIVHLTHAVWRWSDSYGVRNPEDGNDGSKPLLKAKRTVCNRVSSTDQGEEDMYSAVYLGALFSLKEGDRLRTIMDYRLLPSVEFDDGKTFFGVFEM